MSPKYKTMKQILNGLNKYKKIERIVLGFYCINVVIFVGFLVYFTYNIVQINNQKDALNYTPAGVYHAMQVFGWFILWPMF